MQCVVNRFLQRIALNLIFVFLFLCLIMAQVIMFRAAKHWNILNKAIKLTLRNWINQLFIKMKTSYHTTTIQQLLFHLYLDLWTPGIGGLPLSKSPIISPKDALTLMTGLDVLLSWWHSSPFRGITRDVSVRRRTTYFNFCTDSSTREVLNLRVNMIIPIFKKSISQTAWGVS